MDSELCPSGSYDPYTHGSDSFPIGIHKTIVPPNPAVGHGVGYQVLYTHWHSEFEFFYLSRGESVFVIDGEEYTLTPGDAVFVPSNATHRAYRLDSSKDTVFYAVVFSPSLISGGAGDVIYEKYVLPVMGGELLLGPVFRRGEGWQSEVLDRLIEIMACYDYEPYDSDPHSGRHPELFLRADAECPELTIKSQLLAIWRDCVLHAAEGVRPTRIDSANYDRIHRAMEYMHEHYGERITLGELAASVYMSREYFSNIFKKYTRTSPFSYLNGYRVRRSMELLDRTDMKVIEIAARCGFDHVSYFNRKFYELVGCTPTEYRRGGART